jgi:metal-responsive CopG/Arc/MetJ family transcriptional regulator
MRKHPVSIALSNSVLEKIDKEATRQKRSRSEYVELFFEDALFAPSNLDRQTCSPLGVSNRACSRTN